MNNMSISKMRQPYVKKMCTVLLIVTLTSLSLNFDDLFTTLGIKSDQKYNTSSIAKNDNTHESKTQTSLRGMENRMAKESPHEYYLTKLVNSSKKIYLKETATTDPSPTSETLHVKISHIKPEKKGAIFYIRKKDIISRGPSFDSFHHWSQYHHFLIYQKGVPRQKHAINFYSSDGNGVSYEGYSYKPPDISKWDENKSHWQRSGRFPSVEQRIKFYMDRWYDVTAPHLFRHFRAKVETIDYRSETYLDNNNLIIDPLGLDPKSIFDYCTMDHGNLTESQRVKMLYARDMIDMAILNGNSTIPVIVHFGDRTSHVNDIVDISYPVFGKVRNIDDCTDDDADCQSNKTHHVSIIWPMNRGRHLKPASFVPKDDRPWKEKKRRLIWRGGGFGIKDVESLKEESSWKQRFDLVNNHVNSSLVDAKFTGKKQLASAIHGKRLSKHELLGYRYILSIEGNDVSSGLKWMLFSNSVVFLPPVKYVSWAMESLLEPFVHFVPVHANLSNLEEMVRWAEDHEMEARRIAERSTLFIYDLLFHPDAYRDEELILSGIMKRYKENFGSSVK